MKDNRNVFVLNQNTIASKVNGCNVKTLSNEQLLATILGIDITSYGYEEILQILDHTHSLRKASKKTLKDLMSIKGIGEKKATALLAAFEIGKRLMREKAENAEELRCSAAIYELMKTVMLDLEHEEFWILLMNQNFKLIKKVRLSIGGLTECTVDVRIIIKEAVINNATVISVCHNHPSGKTTPSKLDDEITRKIKEACTLMRIFFCDHVIIGDDSFYSYNDEGKL